MMLAAASSRSALVATHVSRTVRALSNAAARPAFDGEQAALYQKMFEQHLIPTGPWLMMVDEVKVALPDGNGRVLDLATGPGEPATLIGKALPNVQVVATDMSEDMVSSALKRSEGVPNVTCMVADMTDLSAFEDGSVDVVTACYGYMFPEDKALALQETHRVLKPGGTLIATYWLEMQMLPLLGEVMTAVLGQTPPPPPQNPLSLKEPGLFESMLATAGFNPPTITESSYPFDLGKDADFQYKIGTMLVKPRLDELDAHAMAREVMFKRLPAFSTKQEDGSVMLGPNRFAMAVAVKP